MFVLHTQGEFGVLVLPERVWPKEHVQPHPGPGQRWVPSLWTTSYQSLILLGIFLASFDLNKPLVAAADQSRLMQEQMTGAAMAMPPDPNKAFKVSCSPARTHLTHLSKVPVLTNSASLCQSEWEALEIMEHKWALENVEEELMSRDLNFGGFLSQDAKSTVF